MPRVFKISKCRKAKKCEKCGCAIPVGEPCIYWTKRVGFGRIHGRRYTRCSKRECYPKASELTSSEFRSAWESIKENADFDSIEDIDSMESKRDEVAGEVGNLRDETQGKLDNMPEGLQQGDTGQLLQERIDGLEEVISNLESVDISFEEPEKDEKEDEDAYEESKAEALRDRLDEIRSELNDALESLSC